MRVDKFLKNSRLIKRRTIAKEACEHERIFINEKQAKPGSDVRAGDILRVCFGSGEIKVRVLETPDHVTKESAQNLYEVLTE